VLMFSVDIETSESVREPAPKRLGVRNLGPETMSSRVCIECNQRRERWLLGERKFPTLSRWLSRVARFVFTDLCRCVATAVLMYFLAHI
jgi:hypothetical protein